MISTFEYKWPPPQVSSTRHMRVTSPFQSEICYRGLPGHTSYIVVECTTNHTSNCNQIRSLINIPFYQELLQTGMLYYHQLSTQKLEDPKTF